MSKNIKKKGDISMETIVVVVIALAVLLVVIGIFVFQSRKGSGKINDIGDSATSGVDSSMCIGANYVCNVTCKIPTNIVADKTCLMPGTVCCRK